MSFSTAIEPIDLAILLPGSVRVQAGNSTETWKGWINTHFGRKSAYIKMLPANQLISEIVCALLGRAIKLNIPTPYLVQVEKSILPQSAYWTDGEGFRFAFALEDLQRMSFSHWAQKDGKILKKLLDWDGYKPSGLFDEWIANKDRNQGNLIYQGRGVWWLIDHGEAFTGSEWKPADLIPEIQVTNMLIDLALKVDNSLDERYRWRDASNVEVVKYGTLPIQSLKDDAAMDVYASPDQIKAVTDFIEQRISYFKSLVCQRLGIGLLSI